MQKPASSDRFCLAFGKDQVSATPSAEVTADDDDDEDPCEQLRYNTYLNALPSKYTPEDIDGCETCASLSECDRTESFNLCLSDQSDS